MTEAVVLQEGVIVAGHPRSGTSLACQLIESAGVEFPSDFEGDEYNQAGYYEMDDAKEASKRVINEAMTEENTELMNSVVRRLNDVDGTPGLKIVRVPALFFYRHLTKDLRTVLVFRDPADVKASLLKRGISAFPISWVDNHNAVIAAYENIEDSIVISYESLIQGADHVENGFRKLGLEVDLSIIDPGQRTQSDSRVYATRDEKAVYDRLREIERESCQ